MEQINLVGEDEHDDTDNEEEHSPKLLEKLHE